MTQRQRRRVLGMAVAGVAALGLAACSSTPPVDENVRTDLIDVNYKAADALVAGPLAQRGYAVKELKLRDNLFMKASQGALLLSREVQDISQTQSAQAVIVGTYTSSGKMLYLSVKLVVPEGNVVLAAHDYAMPIDANIKGLLK